MINLGPLAVDKLAQQEVIASVVTYATISFPEHAPSRVCSRNGVGHATSVTLLRLVLILTMWLKWMSGQ